MIIFHAKWVVLRHHVSAHNHYRVNTGNYHLPGCTHAKTICFFEKLFAFLCATLIRVFCLLSMIPCTSLDHWYLQRMDSIPLVLSHRNFEFDWIQPPFSVNNLRINVHYCLICHLATVLSPSLAIAAKP